MPFQVTRVPNRNIIVLSAYGELTLEQIQEAYREIASLLNTMEGLVYRITDVSDQTMTYEEMLRIVDAAVNGDAGSLTDPRIKNVWVGDGYYPLKVRELLRDRGVTIPLFGTMDEAMSAVERMLDDQSPSPTVEG